MFAEYLKLIAIENKLIVSEEHVCSQSFDEKKSINDKQRKQRKQLRSLAKSRNLKQFECDLKTSEGLS